MGEFDPQSDRYDDLDVELSPLSDEVLDLLKSVHDTDADYEYRRTRPDSDE